MLPLITCALPCGIYKRGLQNTMVRTGLSIWADQAFVTACFDHTPWDAMPNSCSKGTEIAGQEKLCLLQLKFRYCSILEGV